MSIRKQFLKSKSVCKVTFKIPETVGNGVENAHVVGEFNEWSFYRDMKVRKYHQTQ